MQRETERQELTLAIKFARQGLEYAFGDFVSGQTNAVTSGTNAREARDALELLRYLRGLSLLLLPVADIVQDLEDSSLRWLEHNTTRVEGERSRTILNRVLQSVNLVEDQVVNYLGTPPSFAPSLLDPIPTTTPRSTGGDEKLTNDK